MFILTNRPKGDRSLSVLVLLKFQLAVADKHIGLQTTVFFHCKLRESINLSVFEDLQSVG